MPLIRTLLRADARRPASWMACLAALAAASQWAGRDGPGSTLAAWLSGGALAIAAIGAPLPTAAAPLLPASAWAGLRVAWPAAGAVLGAAAGVVVVGDAALGAAARLLLFLLGACAALVVRLAAASAGESEADGVSLSLAMLGAAALVGLSPPPVRWMPWLGGATVVAAWCLLAAALVWLRKSRSAGAVSATWNGPGGGSAPMLLPPLRRWLVGAAMVMALVGMMRWLFLEPQGAVHSLRASLLALVALAAPAAIIGDDALDRRLGRLLATGARGRAVGVKGKPDSDRAMPWRGGSRRASGTGGLSLLGLHAAVIAWPSVVAAALLVGERPRALGAIGVAAAVGLAAAALRLLASRRLPIGSAETRLAASLALAVAIGLVASR